MKSFSILQSATKFIIYRFLKEYAITNQNPSASYHSVGRNRRDNHQWVCYLRLQSHKILYPCKLFLLGHIVHPRAAYCMTFSRPEQLEWTNLRSKNTITNRGYLEILTMPQNMIRAFKMLDGSFTVTTLHRGLILSNTMGLIDPARKCQAWQRHSSRSSNFEQSGTYHMVVRGEWGQSGKISFAPLINYYP